MASWSSRVKIDIQGRNIGLDVLCGFWDKSNFLKELLRNKAVLLTNAFILRAGLGESSL